MGQAIAITNLDYSADGPQHLASKSKDGQILRRLFALALLPEGKSFARKREWRAPAAADVARLGAGYAALGIAGSSDRVSRRQAAPVTVRRGRGGGSGSSQARTGCSNAFDYQQTTARTPNASLQPGGGQDAVVASPSVVPAITATAVRRPEVIA